MNKSKVKVGVFGIGLAAYWAQFEGLRERLEGYQKRIEEKLAVYGAQVTSVGIVDNALDARQAGEQFRRANVDIIICYEGTYATSSQVLPTVQRTGLAVLILKLQPIPALDYLNTDTAEWLANCTACCVPEIANAFTRACIPVNIVTGLLSPAEGTAKRYYERAWKELSAWISAA
ncbi:MAG: arabinose isomerase, partial [Thermonemataceae bacterium]